MKALPKAWMRPPMPLVTKKEPEFFRAKRKACMADMQNELLVRATWT